MTKHWYSGLWVYKDTYYFFKEKFVISARTRLPVYLARCYLCNPRPTADIKIAVSTPIVDISSHEQSDDKLTQLNSPRRASRRMWFIYSPTLCTTECGVLTLKTLADRKPLWGRSGVSLGGDWLVFEFNWGEAGGNLWKLLLGNGTGVCDHFKSTKVGPCTILFVAETSPKRRHRQPLEVIQAELMSITWFLHVQIFFS